MRERLESQWDWQEGEGCRGMYLVGQENSIESVEMCLDPENSCMTPFELPTTYQHTPVCPIHGHR